MASRLHLFRHQAPLAAQISRASQAAAGVRFVRPLHASAAARFPYKDTQNRESLKPSSTEGTKTGRDSDVAADEDAAFNPDKTSPEAEKAASRTGQLDISGANQEASKPQGDDPVREKGANAGQEVRKGGASARKSPPKRGEPKA